MTAKEKKKDFHPTVVVIKTSYAVTCARYLQ